MLQYSLFPPFTERYRHLPTFFCICESGRVRPDTFYFPITKSYLSVANFVPWKFFGIVEKRKGETNATLKSAFLVLFLSFVLSRPLWPSEWLLQYVALLFHCYYTGQARSLIFSTQEKGIFPPLSFSLCCQAINIFFPKICVIAVALSAGDGKGRRGKEILGGL